MQNVLLASTLHDPHGVLLEPLKQALDIVLSNYRGWVFNITAETDNRVKELLKSLGERGIYITGPDLANPIVANKIENDHLNVLREALAIAQRLGINKIQYTDWDRIVVAAKYFPEDLLEMAKVASEIGDTKSYLNLRRSPEDYFTHPPPLVQTELEFNRLYSEVFGIPIDIGSTAHVMSLDVLEEIIKRSLETQSISFPHPKWLIIAKEMGARISSVETHRVLTFETPEQFKEEVGKEVDKGNFQKVTESAEGAVKRSPLQTVDIRNNFSLAQQVYMATLGRSSTLSKEEWQLRFSTERQYLNLLSNHLHNLGLGQRREDEMHQEINQAVVSMEGRMETILDGLSKSPSDIQVEIKTQSSTRREERI